METWNLYTSFIQIFYLFSQNLKKIFLIVFKLCAFRHVAISVIFSSFFIITFDWNGDFEFWWFLRKDLAQIYQNILYLKLIFFLIYKNQFLYEKYLGFFLQFFFKLLPKFSNFINSDDCIGKIKSKAIRYIKFLFKNFFEHDR